MGLGFWDYLSFGEIAHRWASEQVGKPNGFTSEEILQELVSATWRGEFEDNAGTSRLALQAEDQSLWQLETENGNEEIWRINRRDLLTAMRNFLTSTRLQIPSDAFIPNTHEIATKYDKKNAQFDAELWPGFESWRQLKAVPWETTRDNVPWDELAGVPPADYGDHLRRVYLERLCLAFDDFQAWRARHDLEKVTFWRGPHTPPEKTPGRAAVEYHRDWFNEYVGRHDKPQTRLNAWKEFHAKFSNVSQRQFYEKIWPNAPADWHRHGPKKSPQ